MTWILPTLVVATLGNAPALAAPLPAPMVIAQANVPSKGGGEAPARTAPSTSSEGGEPTEAGEPPAGGGGETQGLGTMLLWMGAIFLFFWLFFIRPQNKKMKEHEQMVSSLKKGDAVVTNGGLFGRITGFDDSTGAVLLEIAKDTRVRVLRQQISKQQAPAKSPEEGDDKGARGSDKRAAKK